MATTIKIKSNSTPATPPVAGDLVVGEPAFNSADGKLYVKKADNSIVEIGAASEHDHDSDYVAIATSPVFTADSVTSKTTNTDLGLAGDGTGIVAVNDDLVVTGDLTVQGTTTTIDTAELLVEDKNITMGNVAVPTDLTADGGGITLLGGTNKTIIWTNSTDSWDFNQNVSVTGNILVTGTVDGVDIAQLAIDNTGDQVAGDFLHDSLDYTGSTKYHVVDAGGNVGKVLTASAVAGTFTWESGSVVNDGTITLQGDDSITATESFSTNQATNDTLNIGHLTTDGHKHVPITAAVTAGYILTTQGVAGDAAWAVAPAGYTDWSISDGVSSTAITDGDTATFSTGNSSYITVEEAAGTVTVSAVTTAGGLALEAHTHSTFDRATSGLTGATVFSDIVVLDGITTGISTRTLASGDLSDITLTSASEGDLLVRNASSQWVNTDTLDGGTYTGA